jgi:hypothetical protein
MFDSINSIHSALDQTLFKKPGFFTCLNGQLGVLETPCGAKKPFFAQKPGF